MSGRRREKKEWETGGGEGEICRRVAEARLIAFGRRGRAAMARALGISPSTYNYYERSRVPPATLLARIAEITGARLEWLITGRGPRFAPPEGEDVQGEETTSRGRTKRGGPGKEASAVGNKKMKVLTEKEVRTTNEDLLTRLRLLLETAPRLLQPVGAFVEMLEEMAGRGRRATTRSFEPTPPGQSPHALIPVIGTTAAGVARFWREYAPGGAGVTTIEQRVREVLGRGLHFSRRPAQVSAPVIRRGGLDGEEDRTAALVQMSEPDGCGVLEFVDCPLVRRRVRNAFGLRIDGDSMTPRYNDGDILLLSPDEPAREGEPAVVKLKDQIGATCKLYVVRGRWLYLVPVNENYPTTRHRLEEVEWALAVLWRVSLGGRAGSGG